MKKKRNKNRRMILTVGETSMNEKRQKRRKVDEKKERKKERKEGRKKERNGRRMKSN